jgi:hypothetical protein
MEDNVAWNSYRCCGSGCASFGFGYVLWSAIAKEVVITWVLLAFEIYLSVDWNRASNVLRALVAENSSG